MLVLTRKKEQSIIIGDQIELTILEIKGDQIRIGINAPKDVTILRKEVYLEVEEANRVALASKEHNLESLTTMLKKL